MESTVYWLNLMGLILSLIGACGIFFSKLKAPKKISQFAFLPADNLEEKVDTLIQDINANITKAEEEIRKNNNVAKILFLIIASGFFLQFIATIMTYNERRVLTKPKHCYQTCHKG